MTVANRGWRDPQDASLVDLTEQQLASWLMERGRKVVCHRGRYWLQTYPGFYSATHFMARMKADEATRPSALCWGFRTSLREEDAAYANASIPLYLLSDIANYTWQSRSGRYRNKIRNMRKEVRIVELLGPEQLIAEGHGVVRSAHARNGYGTIPKRAAYRQAIERYYATRRGLVIGGLVEGRLAGYLTSHAVCGTAYLDQLYLATEHLRCNISLGLFFEWVQICRRSQGIREAVHGLHAREAAGLCRYKEELGLAVVQVPARAWFAPLTGPVVRQLRPHAYYRLTGHD